jgi:hypothetical protein
VISIDLRSKRPRSIEQQAGFGLILADVDDVVEDQQMILVELGESAFEDEFTASDLQALDEIARSHEQSRGHA